MSKKANAKAYAQTYYFSAGMPVNPRKCIPLRKYCEKYFLSRQQTLTLLKRKELCAITFRGKLFITDMPPEK
ncbi:hypothetical protein [Kamptonema sp. UHCC 0994]|uniref:hypothetical protein n=1 Tax=Kamptonema sp. UHCC 0994 TaxID=3031329 RepID=UPI0023B98574|nr:hypothetical protein [Kamptonema sp. UHCC 0994]MDF0553876.1 hypothetical protein [Kamptonema sp. UHCC 0994]